MSGAIEVRALEASDADAMRRFFERVPEGDRTFFREDILQPGLIEAWLSDGAHRRVVAVIDGEIGGTVNIEPGVGWSAHVGDVRLVVDASHRGRGLGKLLAQRAVVEAVGAGLTKLVVEVIAEQESTVAMFTRLGFEPEGLLKDHVRSQDGEVHDLLVLSHLVEPLWASMRTTGVEDVVLGDGAG